MFLTADTIDMIYRLCAKEGIYDEILRKFFDRKYELDEFRQHIWLQLCEQPRQKVIEAWNKKWFKYLFVRIVTNQVKSNTSEWFRQNSAARHGDRSLPDVPEDQSQEQNQERDQQLQKKKDLVIEALNHFSGIDPAFFVERRWFELYYFENMSYRQIEKQTQLVNGERVSFQAVGEGIKYVETVVKWYLRKTKKNKTYLK